MQAAQDVSVILDDADLKRGTVDVLQRADQIPRHHVANFLPPEEWLPMLGAEDDVEQDVGKRLGHGGSPIWTYGEWE
jgi:hypothetical protein